MLILMLLFLLFFLILNIQLKKLEFQDESLTSVQAENLLKSYKKPYSKGDIDMNAAAIILSDYLEENF
jgi:RNase H-fold protein (predicted Holliday junction resolvase)